MFDLELPDNPIPQRVSLRCFPKNERVTVANLDGPGCIRHIWFTTVDPRRNPGHARQIIVRIYFDDEPVPYVEAPMADLFGIMHGEDFYELDTHLVSVKAVNGYNCYFPMPFTKSARIEVDYSDVGGTVYTQVDWNWYPGQEMPEKRRFCARWRREMPTERYGKNYLMLDADGPGQLVGFFYGVRLLDDQDRWSHGGAENIYIDGDGEYPCYMRGIGGEDTFGTSYGGAYHKPETHHYAALPYYELEDTGKPKLAPRVVGYRFFEHEIIKFSKSIQIRFGCMSNDICSTVYWYQQGPVRPFFDIPKDWDLLQAGNELPGGTHDRELPSTGQWSVAGPLEKDPVRELLSQNSDDVEWGSQVSYHHFLDFNMMARPHVVNVGSFFEGWSVAKCKVNSEKATAAKMCITWDDELLVKVNDDDVVEMGNNPMFRGRELDIELKAGSNEIAIALSNTVGSNHGGWALACRIELPDGSVLEPSVIE